jgi:hypothetical protein
MTWTDAVRREHNRDGGRYPGDLIDREWSSSRNAFTPASTL